jgi:hypothetical protein
MLFDLRGRGRRRVVRVIYIGLALLMGVGFVGFGVGSFGGGGLFSAATNNEGSNAASFASKIKKYEKITKQQPHNLSAWEGLTKNLLHEAGGEEFTTAQGVVTEKGRDLYIRASHAWNSYIALNPKKPSAELAQLMFTVYGEGGLNQPEKAVEVLQVIVTDRPTAAYYGQLSLYAYKAHEDRIGDLAAAKAVTLAPATQRKGLKKQLAELKKQAKGETTKAAPATTTSTSKITSTTSVKTK